MFGFALHRPVPFLLLCAALLASPAAALGQSPFSSVKMEVALSREGAEWKGEARFNVEGREVASPLLELKIGGAEISFVAKLHGADVRFAGRLDGDKLGGSLEAFEKNSKVAGGTWSLTRGQGGGAGGA
ncbi:MAG TPA: hypothetical protein VD861_17085 [Pyrinomonadaceae bacterium]|nr:hypothetical protein [Pyrinomonadaceae bacterium]